MARTLYWECSSGLSGDMAVASLLDLGASEEVLRKALDSLLLQGFEIRISRVKKQGIDACDFDVVLDEKHDNHDHDMHYLYNHLSKEHLSKPKQTDCSTHGHTHEHPHGHTHEYSHEHTHEYPHEHRGLFDIYELIDAADITERARVTAKKVFHILAEAEAKAHATSLEEVHFHEVGALDSIADIVAAAVCLDDLDIEEVIIPSLYDGCGSVRCQHGIIPVPVPAVVNIVQAYRLPLTILPVQGELLTPTGAALAAAVRTQADLPDAFVVEKVGIGAGKREYETPGVVRAFLFAEE